MKKIFFLLLFAIWVCVLKAQNGCPDCVVNLPANLAEDTIFLTNAPAGQANVYYNKDMSFRLPKSTTPVAATDSTTPPNLPISNIKIVSLTNLPPGLNWEANQREFNTSEQTDGCVKICGTPLIPGLYMVEVVLDVQLVIFSQRTSFSFPMLIQPAATATDGFRMLNNIGCGAIDVTFVNTIPSYGNEGFSYHWDFGNGLASEAENPMPLKYDAPGIYVVNYEAVIDTAGYFLTKVVVEEAACNDILGGKPDLKIDVIDPSGTTIYTSDIITNASIPLTFELVLPLESDGNYSLRVTDDDSGIGGADDVCGVVNFTKTTSGTLNDTDLKVNLSITHPVETILSKDTVFVYAQPAAPAILRMDAYPLCDGDTVRLQVSNFQAGLQWEKGNASLVDATSPNLSITESGDYWVRYTSPDGCMSESSVETISFGAIPSGIVFVNENNTLSVFDPESLPANATIQWAVNNLPIMGAEGLTYCIDSSANYSLIVTDESTGCFAAYSQTITYNPSFPNCISSTDVLDDYAFSVVYPNPFSDKITLEAATEDELPTELRLFSIDGRELIRKKWKDLPGSLNKKELSMYELANGIYILHLFSGQLHQNVKLIKE
ncbi:MAG: T9SS type A sorting domain-containing protein [Saprospiraceae bacterium]